MICKVRQTRSRLRRGLRIRRFAVGCESPAGMHCGHCGRFGTAISASKTSPPAVPRSRRVASHAARPRWYSAGVTSGTKPVTDASMLDVDLGRGVKAAEPLPILDQPRRSARFQVLPTPGPRCSTTTFSSKYASTRLSCSPSGGARRIHSTRSRRVRPVGPGRSGSCLAASRLRSCPGSSGWLGPHGSGSKRSAKAEAARLPGAGQAMHPSAEPRRQQPAGEAPTGTARLTPRSATIEMSGQIEHSEAGHPCHSRNRSIEKNVSRPSARSEKIFRPRIIGTQAGQSKAGLLSPMEHNPPNHKQLASSLW
jgi:hypothetical protein